MGKYFGTDGTMEYLKQLKDLRKRYNKANKYEVEIWSTEKMMAE